MTLSIVRKAISGSSNTMNINNIAWKHCAEDIMSLQCKMRVLCSDLFWSTTEVDHFHRPLAPLSKGIMFRLSSFRTLITPLKFHIYHDCITHWGLRTYASNIIGWQWVVAVNFLRWVIKTRFPWMFLIYHFCILKQWRRLMQFFLVNRSYRLCYFTCFMFWSIGEVVLESTIENDKSCSGFFRPHLRGSIHKALLIWMIVSYNTFMCEKPLLRLYKDINFCDFCWFHRLWWSLFRI